MVSIGGERQLIHPDFHQFKKFHSTAKPFWYLETSILLKMFQKVQVIRILNRMKAPHSQHTINPKQKSEKVVVNVKKYPKWTWFKKTFQEFAANTVLHGYNHIVQADTSKYEKYDDSIQTLYLNGIDYIDFNSLF